MKETNISLAFSREFQGRMTARNAESRIGREAGELAPYDLLLGALGSCYYATFVDITKRMRIAYESAVIDIHGVKREEVPETLQTVTIVLTLKGAVDDQKFRRAAQLAAKYCSIRETIQKVADISLEVRFS